MILHDEIRPCRVPFPQLHSYCRAFVGNLRRLQTLYLSYNELESLPREIGDIADLLQLAVDGNSIRSLPMEIGKISGLVRLSLAGNREIVNPPTVVLRQGTTAILSYMRKLMAGVASGHFDLKGLGLTELPHDITHEFTLLTSLDISNNKIVDLPVTIQNLTNLVLLNMDGNPMEVLQPSLGCVTSLTQIHADNFEKLR